MVSTITEQLARSSFLSCNNKQARQEGTDSPLPQICLFLCLVRPGTPWASGCAFCGSATSLQSPLSLTKGQFVQRKPKGSRSKGSISYTRGRRKIATRTHMHTCNVQFSNPLRNSGQSYSARLPSPLPSWQSYHGGDFRSTGLGIEGCPWQPANFLNRCHLSLFSHLLSEPVSLPPLRYPLCSHCPPAVPYTPSSS